MEKIKSSKRIEKILEILRGKKAKYIVGTTLLSGIGIALPRIFHVLVGSSAGATFLPMHIAVLIASLTFGIFSGSIVATSSIVFSYLLTGMPALARLPYMLIELLIYAVLLGGFSKKFNNHISLISTIILGRIIYSAVLFVSTNVIGLNGYGISVIESVKAGIPGIIIQLLFVPVIAKVMNERLNLKND